MSLALKNLVVGLCWQLADACDCFRTYGRASRQLRVATNFVPFNPDIIPRFDEWVLVARPFLHTYWTCCVRINIITLYFHLDLHLSKTFLSTVHHTNFRIYSSILLV